MILSTLSFLHILNTSSDSPAYHQVTLSSVNEKEYLTAPNGGGGPVVARVKPGGSRQNVVQANDIFVLRDENGAELEDGDVVQLTSWNGQYLSAENGGSTSRDSTVNANRSTPGGWEAFVVVRRYGRGRVTSKDEPINLRSLNGLYLGVEPKTRLLKANRTASEECVFNMTLCSAVIPSNLAWPLSTKPKFGYKFGVDWDVTDKDGNVVKGDDGFVKLHNGYDILGVIANKTEVKAVERGTVCWVDKDKGGVWGNWIVIKHLDRYGSPYTSLYFHVNPKVKPGDNVKKGDAIGTIYPLTVTSPHLHFSIRNAAFEGGWRNRESGAGSAANRGALNRTADSKISNPNYTPKWPEFFFDPGIFTPIPSK